MNHRYHSRVLTFVILLVLLLSAAQFADGHAAAAPGDPNMSINDVILTEANSGTTNLTFTVSLDRPAVAATTVNYATADNTAVAISDYLAASGIATIAVGATSTTVQVKVVGDTLNEANESFSVNLTSAVNATILDGLGVGTITNNDAAPKLSIAN